MLDLARAGMVTGLWGDKRTFVGPLEDDQKFCLPISGLVWSNRVPDRVIVTGAVHEGRPSW